MKTLAIAAIAIRRIARDRLALFFLVLLPFFIIFLIGTATKNIGTAVPIGLVNTSHGALSDALVRDLHDTGHIKVTDLDTVDDLRAAIRRSVYSAGVVIPSDYDTALRAGKNVNVQFMNDIAKTPTVVRTAVTAAVANQGALAQAASFTARNAHVSFDDALADARKTAKQVPAAGVHVTSLGREPRDPRAITSGFGYTAPAQLVLFVFITCIAASGMIVANRQQGITRRMYGTPTTATQIIMGETLGRFALALFQAVYILVIGAFVFGVDWGNALGAGVLITVYVLVGTSFAVLGGTLFRTPEQSSAVGPPVGIAMGMLAGCMWPRFIEPDVMQHIGQLFPQAWAMDGFIKLIARGGGIGDILPELGVLSLFVVVLLPVAIWRLRRSLVA